MGLDWGFSLEDTSTGKTIDLIWFSGNNSQELSVQCFRLGTPIDEYKAFYDEHQLKSLKQYGNILSKIETILYNTSERKVEFSEFTETQEEQLKDLFYDLGISYDDIIITTMRRLNIFIQFIIQSDLLEAYIPNNKNLRLLMWKSY